MAMALLASLLLVGTGCASRPPIYAVAVEPAEITPNGDGQGDVARILYRVGRPMELSIYLQDSQGARHYLRQNEPRSPGDAYEAWFGGTIHGRMLPDGRYKVVLEEGAFRVEKELTIRDADTQPPQLRDFGVSPTRFTPNQDGISDRIAVSFYLTKKARVKVYLEGPDDRRYPIAQEEEKEPGNYNYDYEGGVDKGIVPPPDGQYHVVGEAVDSVGNATSVTSTLEIAQGGLPKAEIVKAELWPLVVPLSGTLHFTATVRNTGTVPIRTTGPAPGTAYTSMENFDTKGNYQEPGAFRLGVDYEGNSIGREYPYRWALGDTGYLAPGETVQITGSIQILEAPPYYESYFWFGLLHERVRKVNDRNNPTQITIAH